MISKSARLAALTLILAACGTPPAVSQAGDADAATGTATAANSSCATTTNGNYSLTVTAELPAGDTRMPALSWESRPAEQPNNPTLQRTIRACDTTTLSADFRTAEGTPIASRPLEIKSETLNSTAGTIQVMGPDDMESSCEDVSVSNANGSCAEARGWFLTFTDPKPGTFQLQAPVDFGTGIEPSTLTIIGTIGKA